MKRIALVALGLLLVSSSAVRAEDPPVAPAAPAAPRAAASLEDRATILRVEHAREGIAWLEPFLAADANPAARRLAVRALGRIGESDGASERLRVLLTADAPLELPLTLWAAGISGDDSDAMAEAIRKHLASDDAQVIGAAAEALGWLKPKGLGDDVLHLLHHPDTRVRTGVATSLARGGKEGHLDRMLSRWYTWHLAGAPSEDYERETEAYAFALWMLAGRRRTVASKVNEAWDGHDGYALRMVEHIDRSPGPQAQLDAIRPMGRLMPMGDVPAPQIKMLETMFESDRRDPRVMHELASRVAAPRLSEATAPVARAMVRHGDAKVRRIAYEALGPQPYPGARALLEEAWTTEKDARLREVLAIELLRAGKREPWTGLVGAPETWEAAPTDLLGPDAQVLREATLVQGLAIQAKADEAAVPALLSYMDPARAAAGGRHTATWMIAFDALDKAMQARAAVQTWYAALLGDPTLPQARPHLFAGALGGASDDAVRALAAARLAEDAPAQLADTEIERALVGALVERVKDETAAEVAEPEGDEMTVPPWLNLLAELSPKLHCRFAHEAAIDGIEAHGSEAMAERVTKRRPPLKPGMPVLPAFADQPALDARGVLELADWIEAKQVRVVLETTAGEIKLSLDPQAAPMHSASLVRAVRAGLYTNTRWHRVVPSFVIQGGDPHGHGGGGGGWTVPDEISKRRYARGALGMPKSVKDDGGCQIFIMHSGYRPLDERYTNYGDVVEGMEAVDRIRVGDLILKARLEVQE